MAIKDWPQAERPREKLLARGPESLSDAKLLAIFLRTGSRGKTAVDLSRELLVRFEGLRSLLEADFNQFRQAKRLGPSKFVQIQAALELGKRHLESSLKSQQILNNPKQTRDFLRAKLRAYQHKVFTCLFLDNRHRVICFEELFTGTIDGASVHPREVVKRALHHNAAAVILAHNHPSGVAEPSHVDQSITRRLQEALSLVDTRALEHIVIGDGETVSFAERGLI
jgi:DNA repair protein RadC